MVYNEINLGFCCLVIYTDETGIRTARLKSTTEEGYSDIVVPSEEIYTEEIEEQLMKCWHCNTELIWGGDHDISEEDETYAMSTNLSCPQCESIVDVYLPKEGEKKDA